MRSCKRNLKRPPTLTLSRSYSYPTPIHRTLSVEEHRRAGLIYSVCSRRGRRKQSREDTCTILPFVTENEEGLPISIFCLFDGHGGDGAAQLASRRIPQLVLENLGEGVESALRKAFEVTDSEVNGIENRRGKGLEREGLGGGSGLLSKWVDCEDGLYAPRAIEKKNEFDERGRLECGTTATVVVLVGNEVYVAHVGDSRAIMGRNGEIVRLCEDHRAGRKDEMERIEKAGGLVVQTGGGWRVNGVLAVSRAIGDGQLKDWVIADPDVTMWRGGDWIVIASDGLWDFVDEGEVGNVWRDGAQELVKCAWERGSADDICVVVVDLDKYRQVWKVDDVVQELEMVDEDLPLQTPRVRDQSSHRW